MKPYIMFICPKYTTGEGLMPTEVNPDDPYYVVTFDTSDFSVTKVTSTSMSPAEAVAFYDTPAVWSTLSQIKAVVGNGFVYMETETTGVSIEPGNRVCYYYDNTGENNVYKVNMGAEMFNLFLEKEENEDENGN